MRKPIVIKMSKDFYKINITGNRDPRSPDVNIEVDINKDDELIITVNKDQNCYRYDHTVDFHGMTKLYYS